MINYDVKDLLKRLPINGGIATKWWYESLDRNNYIFYNNYVIRNKNFEIEEMLPFCVILNKEDCTQFYISFKEQTLEQEYKLEAKLRERIENSLWRK